MPGMERSSTTLLPPSVVAAEKKICGSASLRKISPEVLIATPEWVVYGALRERLEAARDLRVCRDELWPVSHTSGWQANLAGVAARQPVGTPELRSLARSRFR